MTKMPVSTLNNGWYELRDEKVFCQKLMGEWHYFGVISGWHVMTELDRNSLHELNRFTLPYIQGQKAEDIESVLCLATLIANGELTPAGTLEQAEKFWRDETKEDCGNCPFHLTCLACIINE